MEDIEKDISLYKIKLKISDVQERDTIVVIGIRGCILYFGNISKENNIIEFNYSNCGVMYRNHESPDLKKIKIRVLSLNKEYGFKILSVDEISDYKTFVILGDSHSYMHGMIDKYFSWAQYFPYIVNDNIMILNLANSGVILSQEISKFNKFNKTIKNINNPNSYLLICDGANTSKPGALNKSIKWLETPNFENIQYKYFLKMYPISYKNDFLRRATNIENYLIEFANQYQMKYFNIDELVESNKDYIKYGFCLHQAHTNIYGGIIIGNIIKYKLKEFGLDIFNRKNLIDQVELINEIILKHFHD